MSARIVYSDLDGTMVGPGGCFVRAEGGALTLQPARALVDLHAAGIPLVLVSGRTRAQLVEACRIFGADGFIAEMGAVIGWDGGRSSELQRGSAPSSYAGPPLEVADALLARYPGRLEYHSPWHEGHEVDVMLRGLVEPAEAEAWLASRRFGWLRLLDNGVLPAHRSTTLLPEAIPAHVYHLMPAGLSKGAAVAADLARRGIDPADAVAIGDSASDLDMAPRVGRMFLTANGAGHEHMTARVGAHPNLTVTAAAMGLGWVEAVRAALD